MAKLGVDVQEIQVNVFRPRAFWMYLIRPEHAPVALKREIREPLGVRPPNLLRKTWRPALGWPASWLQTWGALKERSQKPMDGRDVMRLGFDPVTLLAHVASECLG
jgi:hypothetical protein